MSEISQSEIDEVIEDLAKNHRDYSMDQFTADFKSTVERNPTFAEKRLFQKIVGKVKEEKLNTGSSSSPSLSNSSSLSLSSSFSSKVINGYTIGEVLGKGGFGEVYKCRKGDLEYAIKHIDESGMSSDAEQGFADSISARLNCKFLVRYFEKFRDNKGLFIVMELCKKGDLRALIDKLRELNASLNIERLAKITIQLLLGLDILHSNKILHRDLKPENVFIDDKDNVKLGDFGCSKELDTTSKKANTMIGTPLYESPEVIRGEEYDSSADMWSLGVLLYELCTLERPFNHSNRFQLQQLIFAGKYKPIPRNRYPADIADVVDGLLKVNPKMRLPASSLLQNSFIQEFAKQLNLLKFFPKCSPSLLPAPASTGAPSSSVSVSVSAPFSRFGKTVPSSSASFSKFGTTAPAVPPKDEHAPPPAFKPASPPLRAPEATPHPAPSLGTRPVAANTRVGRLVSTPSAGIGIPSTPVAKAPSGEDKKIVWSDDTQVLVIDNGSLFTKAGISGNDSPSVVIPTVVGRPRSGNSKELYFGERAWLRKGILLLHRPVEGGVVTNWEEIELLWEHVFGQELHKKPKEHPVLLTEPPLNPKKNRETMTTIMFEAFNVPALYISVAAVSSLYATGRTMGVVVDFGQVTRLVPIKRNPDNESNSQVVSWAVSRFELGGDSITDLLVDLLSKRGYSVTTTGQRLDINDVKEKLCYVAKDFSAECKAAQTSKSLVQAYEMPDGKVISIGDERFRCVEQLFDPSLASAGIRSKAGEDGVHKLLNRSIQQSDTGVRKDYYSNVVLSGGTSMFKGLPERLSTELTSLAPKDTLVKVEAPPERRILAWIGGSIIASLSNFQKDFIMKSEYDEHGPGIVHKKCFS